MSPDMIRRAFFAVILMAVITYFIRMLPLTLFRKELKSRFIKTFLYYVPYAVLGSLTFPGIFYSTGNVTTAVVGSVVALILAYLEKGLVVVAMGGIIAVFLSGI